MRDYRGHDLPGILKALGHFSNIRRRTARNIFGHLPLRDRSIQTGRSAAHFGHDQID